MKLLIILNKIFYIMLCVQDEQFLPLTHTLAISLSFSFNYNL